MDRDGHDRAALQRAAGLGARRLLGGCAAALVDGAGRRGHAAAPAAARARARSVARDGGAALLDGEHVVAEARPAALDVAGPSRSGSRRRRGVATRFAWEHDHPFPTCFGCGPERDPADALCLFCGPVGDGRFAVPWTPPAWTGDGVVDPLFVLGGARLPELGARARHDRRAGRARAAHGRARGPDRGRRAARDPVVARARGRAQAPHRRSRSSRPTASGAHAAARCGSSWRGRWARERAAGCVPSGGVARRAPDPGGTSRRRMSRLGAARRPARRGAARHGTATPRRSDPRRGAKTSAPERRGRRARLGTPARTRCSAAGTAECGGGTRGAGPRHGGQQLGRSRRRRANSELRRKPSRSQHGEAAGASAAPALRGRRSPARRRRHAGGERTPRSSGASRRPASRA